MCISSYWFFYFYLASARLLVQFQSETQLPFGLHQKAIYLLEGASSLVLLLRFRSAWREKLCHQRMFRWSNCRAVQAHHPQKSQIIFSIKIQCGSIKYTLGVAAKSGQQKAADVAHICTKHLLFLTFLKDHKPALLRQVIILMSMMPTVTG